MPPRDSTSRTYYQFTFLPITYTPDIEDSSSRMKDYHTHIYTALVLRQIIDSANFRALLGCDG